MARYRMRPVGVYDTLTASIVLPTFGATWHEYIHWLAAGGVPDPYLPPVKPPETLAQAKERRILQIKSDGLAHIAAEFPVVTNFDLLLLIREIWLSIAPAARQPTTPLTFAINTYQAGTTAIAAVHAATTIAQVDAVTVSWPT